MFITKKEFERRQKDLKDQLNSRISSLQEEVYYIKHTPQFKVGDKVVRGYTTRQLTSAGFFIDIIEWNSKEFTVISCSRVGPHSTDIYGNFVGSGYEYEIVDKAFNKIPYKISEDSLKLYVFKEDGPVGPTGKLGE